MNAEKQLARIMRLTMEDIRVECDDEFQQNFRREAFFSDRWQRRKYDDGSGRKILQGPAKADDVHLSQSLFPGKVNGNTLTYSTSLPYAALHNDGGVIRITAKMKRFFWAKYMEATGSVSYRKDGEKRETKKNRRLDADAEFYKAMALKKEGSRIVIPRRRFIGTHPDLEKGIIEIIENNLKEFFESEDFAHNINNK